MAVQLIMDVIGYSDQYKSLTLVAHDDRPFIGVIMNVHVADTDDLVGRFLSYSDNKTKTGSCSGDSMNYITHANNLAVTKMEVTWVAPEEEIGDVTFRATFMELFDLFWINVKTDLISKLPLSAPVKDKEGDDQTITCTYAKGKSTFQYGINVIEQNYRQSKRGRLTQMTTSYRDGSLYCSFTMPIVMNATDESGRTVTYDLHNPYHVMLAWGRLHEGTDVITKHDELPIQSINKIHFDAVEIHRATALPLITRIHGILMLTAWILFVGVATVVARHYRPMYPAKLVCGTKVWFQIHRFTAITVFIFTAVSFVIIFFKVDGLSDHVGVHSWLGIAVMSCVCLQMIGGLLRPSPDNRVRPVFNYLHWGIGKSAQILADMSFYDCENPSALIGQEVFHKIRKNASKSSEELRHYCISSDS
ncbi:putative ferric-chelate reductase 1 [Pecten maximus]|uniref:putative ferric-chelate reductase 1 n=1 Tax=Pecten maximus TaxID=6579 RepID=UPI0014580983|nr:putative ferric-chelate reductase 1 [Pecten maximus]